MSGAAKTAVLLLAHGSPDNPAEVPDFLRFVTSGRGLPQAVIDEVAHRYALIGRSPLTEITLRQGQALARELNMPVYVGMRNWKPFIADAVRQMASDAVQHAIVICLAPHNSRTSVGLYRKALDEACGSGSRTRSGQVEDPSPHNRRFTYDFVENWHDHPLLVKAFAERLQAGWKRACEEAGAKVPVIFTAHSVPTRTVTEGDPYEQQAKETADMVAMEIPSLTVDDWTFAFQSQGMSGGPWLGPTVEETIRQLKAKGHAGVFVQPIGFVCDHVEVLYDVDIAFRKLAEENGMKLWRAESLNDSPTFIAALADVARSRMEQPAEERKAQIVNIK
ncbi:MAG TPA: ferrochelatase [Terriglobales bacterium]|nr:ferrochelatase [Terriglobales bacterium]